MMIDALRGIEIYLRDEVTVGEGVVEVEVEAADEAQEVIAMSLRCRWVEKIGRRA